MLQAIAPDLWHAQHQFTVNGLAASSRMTVVRLADGSLWLHSPVPMTPALGEQLATLGEVACIVAPNKMHHLFLSGCAAAFPAARLFGAPGLARKRPDVAGLRTLGPAPEAEWAEDFDQILVRGIPIMHETVWFHRASRTLILTDLCQRWDGALPLSARAYATLTGVHKRLAVPRTVRLLVKDRHAVAASARQILAWPFERVIMAHNSIVEQDAHAAVAKAFAVWTT